MAILTINGFARYMQQNNDDLFKHLQVPEGIDKDTLTNNILLKSGEFEVIYSNPYFMQEVIRTWSNKWQRTFSKWVEAANLEYNPLENYDRFEDWSDNGSVNGTHQGTVNGSHEANTTNTGTVTDAGNDSKSVHNVENGSGTSHGTDVSSGSGDNTTLNNVSAYNSDTLRADTESISNTDTSNNSTTDASTTTNNELTGSETNTTSNTRTDNLASSESATDSQTNNSSDNQTTAATHTGRVHGNIGVTTSMQLLEAQYDISYWNVYEHITDLFLNEFVIPLY